MGYTLEIPGTTTYGHGTRKRSMIETIWQDYVEIRRKCTRNLTFCKIGNKINFSLFQKNYSMLPETIALSWTDKDKIEEKRGERGEDKREKRERERERAQERGRELQVWRLCGSLWGVFCGDSVDYLWFGADMLEDILGSVIEEL